MHTQTEALHGSLLVNLFARAQQRMIFHSSTCLAPQTDRDLLAPESCPCHHPCWWPHPRVRLHQSFHVCLLQAYCLGCSLSQRASSFLLECLVQPAPYLCMYFLMTAGIEIKKSGWKEGFVFSLFQMDTQSLLLFMYNGYIPPSTSCTNNTGVAGFHVTAQSCSCQASLHFFMFPALFLCHWRACRLFQSQPSCLNSSATLFLVFLNFSNL